LSDRPARLLVRDLMKVGVLTCPPSTPVTEIARLLMEKNLEAVVVLDPEDGNALGVVGQDELVRAYANRPPEAVGQLSSIDLTAADVMREGVPQAPADIPLTAAVQIMQDQHLRVLFLMHHAGGIEYPAAWLSYNHILRHLAARDEAELSDLGIRAERQTPLETFIQKRDAAQLKNIAAQRKNAKRIN
jgi:CBS domain-containing protein